MIPCVLAFLYSRIKLAFHQSALKWTTTQGTVVLTLSGRNYITCAVCRCILAAAASELSSVAVDK